MLKHTIILAAILACTGSAEAGPASIWGTTTPPSGKTAIIAPAPQNQPATPYTEPAPQARPMTPYTEPAPQQLAPVPVPKPTQEQAPKPTWNLKSVPSDPMPRALPQTSAHENDNRPAIVMDEKRVFGAVKNQKSREFLEQYRQGDSFVFPQNPPEMNEKTAKILPYSQQQITEEPEYDSQYIPDVDEECPTGECPEPI